MNPIYVDLDDTLVYPEQEKDGSTRFAVRPWAPEFVEALTQHGDVFLLTHATRAHALAGLSKLGPAKNRFSGIFSREDLAPIIEQVLIVDQAPDLMWEERLKLYAEISPIAPPGVVFDDRSVGSSIFWIKSRAVGIGPDLWIQVPAFLPRREGDRALQSTYKKFVRNFVAA